MNTELTYSNIINLSNSAVTFESLCDGTCRAIVGATEYSWDVRNGGILLNLERWTRGSSKPSDAYAITSAIRTAYPDVSIFGNF